ncbi:MAG: response regulator [Planctomycetota bacterium]|nr:response regulator [Planctomycetota bacterium]
MNPSIGTILIVDDEPHVIYVVKFKLEKAGYEVHTATNGKRAYDLALELRPDLIVTDFQMPGGSGLDLALRLNANEETSSIPLLMVTSRGHRVSPSELIKTNIKQVLAKPFSPRELISVIHEQLPGLHQGESENRAA